MYMANTKYKANHGLFGCTHSINIHHYKYIMEPAYMILLVKICMNFHMPGSKNVKMDISFILLSTF